MRALCLVNSVPSCICLPESSSAVDLYLEGSEACHVDYLREAFQTKKRGNLGNGLFCDAYK